jgi:hypothetical protein
MRSYKSLVGSIVGGIAITLLTGFLNSASSVLAQGSTYGFPMAWLQRLPTAAASWKISATGLIVDIVIWVVIIEILYLAVRVTSAEAKAAARSKTAAASRARARRKRGRR